MREGEGGGARHAGERVAPEARGLGEIPVPGGEPGGGEGDVGVVEHRAVGREREGAAERGAGLVVAALEAQHHRAEPEGAGALGGVVEAREGEAEVGEREGVPGVDMVPAEALDGVARERVGAAHGPVEGGGGRGAEEEAQGNCEGGRAHRGRRR